MLRTSLLTLALLGAAPALAQTAPPAANLPTSGVSEREVRAHMSFLASEALAGRASASRDEAIAAAYVGARFESYGLRPAPGMTGYTQSIALKRRVASGASVLTIGGRPVAGQLMLSGPGGAVSGTAVIAADLASPPAGDVLVSRTAPGRMPRLPGVKLLLIPESPAMRSTVEQMGGPRLPAGFADGPAPTGMMIVAIPAEVLATIKAGAAIRFEQPFAEETATTTNAIGYLPGSDPAAGVLLLSAHLDHIGRRADGKLMLGANDDASGTTAVLELARVLAGDRQRRRGILFVGYGSEERGGFGARRFAQQPPVPLDQIVANVEFEMIGQQDPKLPAGTMMMTGYERSTLGDELKRHGALVTTDPYPEQNFFARSDNYALALAGVVAHTVSGWATVPSYHTPNDTLVNIDFAFMTRAIGSLVEPVRRLADANSRPSWKPGGRPTP